MKRKIALTISLIFFILVGITYYYVTPSKNIDFYESAGNKNLIKVLMSLSSVSLREENLQAELNQDNINDIIETLGVPLKYKAELNDNTVDVYVYTKLINFIDTYYKLTFSLDDDDGKIVLKLLSSKLGKLNISNEKVLDKISSSNSNKDILVEINNKRIIFANDILYFNNLEMKNNILFLECNVNSDKIEDVIKNSIENIINIFR